MDLTNPGLAYQDPGVVINPATGQPMVLPPRAQYFPNKQARGKALAEYAGQNLPPFLNSAASAMPISGVEPPAGSASAATSPVPPPAGMSVPSEYKAPTEFQPSFRQVAGPGPNGMPQGINPAETKLGKLAHILMSAAQGAANGYGQMSPAAGAQAARDIPFQHAERAQQLTQGGLQTQMMQAQVGMLPWERMQKMAQLQKLQAETRKDAYLTPRSGGVYDVGAGGYAPNAGPTEGNSDKQTFDFLTSTPQPGLNRPMNPAEAMAHMAQIKQDMKPDSGAVAKQNFQAAVQKVASEGLITPGAMGSLPAMTGAIQKSKTLSPAEKQGALSYLASTPTPASQGSNMNLKIAGLAATRGVPAVTDTKTGTTGPVTWEELNRAAVEEPGRYQSPQYGQTGERVKFLQQYENPTGRSATNRQALNNIMQHAGDLASINDEYRKSGDKTGVKIINTPLNAIARQFGNETYTRFVATNDVLKDEISLYFAAGYAPNSDQLKRWEKIQSDDSPPSATEAFAKEITHLALRRANTFNENFKKNMDYDDPNMITPAAAAAAQKLGLGDEVKKFGSGGQYGQKMYQGQSGNPNPAKGGPAVGGGAGPAGATHIVPGPDGKNHYTNAAGTVDLGVAP